ncbi:Solute carrier family 2, facilitated glucose transporter member 2 [Hypsibius exemplaris]|uniref:Solute carrier family 2, facilitated glucose transporter member 2 n=1 Tax=Hypsibius exemplaris TaxID=2072580 RepID=A0A1W0WJK4_HYPEX|nr:Solute carrier family 2, facilitated glucose transporter member 2 [Hypsibius exemplaris]
MMEQTTRRLSGIEMSARRRLSKIVDKATMPDVTDLLTATREAGITRHLLFLVLMVTFGTGFPLGYNIVALNAPQTVVVNWIRSTGCRRMLDGPESQQNSTRFWLWCHGVDNTSDNELILTLAENQELNTIWALTSSLFSLGGMTSAVTTGYLIKPLGLKKPILLNAGLLICGTIISCLSHVAATFEMLIVGRIIVGLAVGSGCVLVPMYINEVSPIPLRGALGTLPTTLFIFGMITATILGLPFVLGNERGWSTYLALHLVPVVVMCAALPWCPESPRQLYMRQNRKADAELALRWLRKREQEVQEELQLMKEEMDREKFGTQISLVGLLRDPFLRSALWLCAVPMAAMHTSGFSCLSFYSTFIFTSGGLNPLTAIYASLGLWTTFLIMNLLSLVLVDRNGRRVLLITSHIGVLSDHPSRHDGPDEAGFCGHRVRQCGCIFSFIVFHGLSLFSVPWILGAELFAQEARTAALMFISIVCWGTELVAILLFPLVIAHAQEYTFCIFIGFVLVTGGYTFWKVRGDQGETVEEIQILLLHVLSSLSRSTDGQTSSVGRVGQKSGHKLTGHLFLLVFLISGGTWFSLGFNIVVLNGTRSVIVQWIRNVECQRLTKNDAIGSVNDSTVELWCKDDEESISAEGNGTIVLLAENAKLNTIWLFTSSCILAGKIGSTLSSKLFVRHFGLKLSILLNAGVSVVGTIFSCLSLLLQSYEVLIVGRTLVGFAVGFGCALTPMYISEISPASLRGALGTLPVTMSIFGMLIATLFGLPFLLGNVWAWPILLALHLIPVAVMCAALPCCPDSPRQLFRQRDRPQAAEKALIWLRQSTDVQGELEVMRKAVENEKDNRPISILGLLRDPFLRSSLWICSVPMMAMQLSGFSCLSFYSTSIFITSGLCRLHGLYASLGLWSTYLLTSLASTSLVDRLGRRFLLLTSHVGVVSSLAFLVLTLALTAQGFTWTKYGSVAAIFLFIISHGVSLMSVPWILGAELFTQQARVPAMTLLCLLCWTTEMGAAVIFPIIFTCIEELTFVVFLGCVVCTGLFVYCRVPETKGKSLEQIQAVLKARSM